MTTDVITSFISSAGIPIVGGGLLGYCCARAVRLAARIAAVVIGAIVLVLAFLSWKHDIIVDWNNLSSQTQSAIYNASHQVLRLVNETYVDHNDNPDSSYKACPPIRGNHK